MLKLTAQTRLACGIPKTFLGDRSVFDAIGWLLCQRTVAGVICGATKAAQVGQNVAASTWVLSAEELAEVDKLTRPA
ncbi:aldo/keto reductase [Hydrocarboniphaga effusa]|uniref:aldo/keto reductase n=1 Tax=Hydrocarboniphaga effusa TaxID=243629 RepID=UPI0035B3FB4E